MSETEPVLAERQVVEAKRIVDDQRLIVTRLEQGGHDTTMAAGLLKIYEHHLSRTEARRTVHPLTDVIASNDGP